MKFIAISDTHGHHNNIKLPAGDILIHAGDFTKYKSSDELEEFNNWLMSLNYQYKIF